MSYDKYILNNRASDVIKKSINVKVTFENGDFLTTALNTDLEGAEKYYLNKLFNIGKGACDLVSKAIKVEEII